MVLATSRFPMMVPPVHENVPLPVKLPGPDNSAFPVSTTVVAAAIDTLAARVNASPRSNSTGAATAQVVARGERTGTAEHVDADGPKAERVAFGHLSTQDISCTVQTI